MYVNRAAPLNVPISYQMVYTPRKEVSFPAKQSKLLSLTQEKGITLGNDGLKTGKYKMSVTKAVYNKKYIKFSNKSRYRTVSFRSFICVENYFITNYIIETSRLTKV